MILSLLKQRKHSNFQKRSVGLRTLLCTFASMERLWSPWRSHFIETHDEIPKDPSPFLVAWEEPEQDAENMMLYRGDRAFIILNKYPYNAGHLLVVPVRQIKDLLSLDDEERYEVIDLVALGTRVLQHGLEPDGFNIGMNLGRTAGSAIETHLHVHIVPRWNGDTNFMPTLNETRVVSQNMTEVYQLLVRARDTILS